jgi:hypothetical protein
MNNNKNDETALLAHCKGVFGKTGYITIGTQEYVTCLGSVLAAAAAGAHVQCV